MKNISRPNQRKLLNMYIEAYHDLISSIITFNTYVDGYCDHKPYNEQMESDVAKFKSYLEEGL